MSEVFKISDAIIREPDFDSLKLSPEFRRATKNMILASLAIDQCMSRFEFPSLRSNLGSVLSTNHGEIEVTKNFLKGIASGDGARPMLFQNSLHSSTLGFLSIHYKITGPCLTLSAGPETYNSALEISKDLIRSGDCEFCLSIAVDWTDAEFDEILGTQKYDTKNSARCSLLSSKKGLEALKIESETLEVV